MRFYRIDDPIYLTNMAVVIGDRDDFNKYLTDCGVPKNSHANGVGKSIVWVEGKMYLIWISRLENNYNFATLMHELRHFVDDVLDSRGIRVNCQNGEVAAYYTHMLTLNILNKLKLNVCASLGSRKSATKKK